MKNITKNGKAFRVDDSDESRGTQEFRTMREWFWDEMIRNKWEDDTFSIFDHFIDAEHSYIDVGAWIGPTALYGCQIARHCHAIEPDPIAFEELQKNVDLNPALRDRITLHQLCIGDENGSVRLGNKTHFGNSTSSILHGGTDESCLSPSLTLEEFIRLNDIDDCNFIKLDIEGAETIVLPNIMEYVCKEKPTIHLSLHPMMFDNIEEESKTIIESLKIYRNIYNNRRELLNLNYLYDEILMKQQLYDVVATDRAWR